MYTILQIKPLQTESVETAAGATPELLAGLAPRQVSFLIYIYVSMPTYFNKINKY